MGGLYARRVIAKQGQLHHLLLGHQREVVLVASSGVHLDLAGADYLVRLPISSSTACSAASSLRS